MRGKRVRVVALRSICPMPHVSAVTRMGSMHNETSATYYAAKHSLDALAVGKGSEAQLEAVQLGNAPYDRDAQAAAAFLQAVGAVEALTKAGHLLGRQWRPLVFQF